MHRRLWLALIPAALVVASARQGSPVLSPAGELATMRPVEGYRIELVAAEPLVRDPIAIDFDADGRMYVVEMRGYMPNLQGTGEDRPVGRIVVVEDTSGDGTIDRSTVFLDSLVLPRAVKVLSKGVLVAAPPYLWLARDTNGDLKADTREVVRSDYGDPKGNPEHNANGLLWGIDNWIHNANYGGQFRVGADGRITYRRTPSQGQWGVSADQYGRLYRNSNEDPLRTDLVSSHYATRNPNLANARGVYEQLTRNVAVFPAHKTPALNRGYRAQTMRADSTLAHYTSAGSPTAYIGDRLPGELKRSVFITESAGNMVGRLVLSDSNGMPTARTAYDKLEFLTASDERFRPVNLANAPDGTLYIVDMYRGIIQHRTYITGYLETQIKARGLEQPVGLGRIWRVMHERSSRGPAPRLSVATPAALVDELSSLNGWRRFKAQQILVERGDTSVARALRRVALTGTTDVAMLHALWTLDGLNAADRATIERGLFNGSPAVRAAAVRIAEPFLARGDSQMQMAVLRLTSDPSADVRRQLAASIGELPVAERDFPLRQMIANGGHDPVIIDMVVTALAGREFAFLGQLFEHVDTPRSALAAQTLARAITTSRDSVQIERLVDIATEKNRAPWQRDAIFEGMRRPPNSVVATLPRRPAALIAMTTSPDTALRARATQLSANLGWPGKKKPRVSVGTLTPAERTRFAAGQLQYKATCAGCHQPGGTGLASVAKPLIGSAWVLGEPDRLIRIILHGKEGAMLMPPAGSTLSNEQVADVLTYVRRAWGNSASVIEPNAVREVRGLTTGRTRPWTDEELRRARR